MKRFLLIVAGFVFMAAVIFFALCRVEPDVPVRWEKIYLGQPRDRVIDRMPELNQDVYEVKKVDQGYFASNSRLFGQTAQYIRIQYDPANLVESVSFRTKTERFALLRNTDWREQKLEPYNEATH